MEKERRKVKQTNKMFFRMFHDMNRGSNMLDRPSTKGSLLPPWGPD